ncbi:MAG: 3-methyl-2-oxobutanoate hydroxymethyltransferase [uncultured bacterium]|nr:MAG: 3-methyl-2-oxobutanoate hydroxymethyltransferase [uncultured bacterium]
MYHIFEFQKKKMAQEKISMITCYDFTSAKIIDKTNIDCILVGDSVSMVVHGCHDTTGATMEMMALHTSAVAKGAKNKFIIADLPFASYRKSLSKTISAMEVLIRAGAHAVKLEGASGNLNHIRHAVESGIPVMGHLGLTPQHINTLGGFKVQGKDESSQNKLLRDAKLLEEAGCFSLVLECVPAELAKKITNAISIPTIGIGAGLDTDGQVLVMHDLLGLQTQFKPKFLKQYFNAESAFTDSINCFDSEVKTKQYPSVEHSY